jgi:hypothetical protein
LRSVEDQLAWIQQSLAFIRTRSRHLIAANGLGDQGYSPFYDDEPSGVPNTARFLFLNSAVHNFFSIASGLRQTWSRTFGRKSSEISSTRTWSN